MLTRWNDWGFGGLERDLSALTDLRQQMDRLFIDFERGLGRGQGVRSAQSEVAGSAWPRVSLYDAGTELRLLAEVPGVSQKDLEISVEQSSLSIRGERKAEVPEGYSVHRRERGTLTFARSFVLPCRVDTEKVTADLKNGVLEMKLPKVAEEQPRQIQVRGS
ncbi:MAG: Hsp20/alpha crystallin family protein [Polyangiales bacterium]